MNVRQEQFHHFINEFNYLYQQTKTVSLPPSLSLNHLLYLTVLFPTMTLYPQTRVIKERGHSKLKTCDTSEDGGEKNIKIAHLVSSSFRKESGVENNVHGLPDTDTHTFPAAVLKKLTKYL